MNTVWLAFLTGLTTGGISCLAVQGGLLASSVAASKGEQSASEPAGKNWRHVGIFLVAKLLAYTLLGLLLGTIGSMLTLSPKVLGGVQIAVGVFMLLTAARIMDLHPIFRYFVIQPPRWVYRLLKNQSRDSSLFGPAILGFLTILMPCGVTQATMAVAVASGKPLMGAAIMFAFVLGTSPLFFALGATVVELLKRKFFSYAAAGVVAVFAVLSINGGLALQGSLFTIQNIVKAATTPIDQLAQNSGAVAGVTADGKQDVTIYVKNNGYSSSVNTLSAGIPVRLSLITNKTQGCSRAFTIPAYGISKVLPETGTEVIEFTPQKAGRLAYTCAMGMYTGSFNIVGGGT